MEQDPGMRGMLSFLETPPAEKARLIGLRDLADRQSPMGLLHKSPTGEVPLGHLLEAAEPEVVTKHEQPESPMGCSPMGQSAGEPHKRPMGQSPQGQQSIGELRMGRLLLETATRRGSPPFIEIEGVGRRRLQYCSTVQDAHTSGELVAYQALWIHAKKNGRTDGTGYIIDLSLRQLCPLWKTDHKHAKHLLTTLVEKQNIEVIRLPNYQLGLATRYRIFDFGAILQRRVARGMVWVVRTRTTRFVELPTVRQLISEQPMGQSPMGDLDLESESPMGEQPKPPAGEQPDRPMGQQPTVLNKEVVLGSTEGNPTTITGDPAVSVITAILREELSTVDNDAAMRIVANCRAKAPDASPREFDLLGRSLAQRLKTIRSVENPVAMMITRLSRSFEGDAFRDFREAERQLKDQQIRRCQYAINDPEEFEEVKQQARAKLAELENQ
jgi:uncharacterized protein YukE